MPRYLALLRGINVGGRNKVAMADLRELAVRLGHADVATYIQSGNLLFSSEQDDEAGLAATLASGVADKLGVRCDVVVVSAAGLAAVVADSPFPSPPNPKFLHAVFHQDEPGPARLATIAAEADRARAKGSGDEAVVVGRTLYLHTPGGFGTSELAARLIRPGVPGTARNWVTVTKLMDMMGP